MISIYNENCLDRLKTIADNSIDLIVTDPPYIITNTVPGDTSKLCKRISKMFTEIADNKLDEGITSDIILPELVRVQKNINCYIWCSNKQIPIYLDFFVKKHLCKYAIYFWVKTNAMPLFSNKHLSDKEYCLYFNKGGYFNPQSKEDAATVYTQPINIKDKNKYGHPTIKPLNIIEVFIRNSSKEGDLVLDPYMGSGTTGVACKHLGRSFVGTELSKEYFQIAQKRINE